MSRQANKVSSMRPARPELVMVALAEEASFARHFEKILRRDNIPVKIRNQHEPTGRFRIGLWVPRTLMERALRLLQSENALDGFYEALSEPTPIDGSE
jgi:hypothetical protein